jgi:hypothetical protein
MLEPVGPVWTRTRIHGNPVPTTAGLIPYGDGEGLVFESPVQSGFLASATKTGTKTGPTKFKSCE